MPKSKGPCPSYHRSLWPPAQKSEGGSLLNRPACSPTIQSVKGLDITELKGHWTSTLSPEGGEEGGREGHSESLKMDIRNNTVNNVLFTRVLRKLMGYLGLRSQGGGLGPPLIVVKHAHEVAVVVVYHQQQILKQSSWMSENLLPACGGGGFFLACQDFRRMFDNSFPTCACFFFVFFFKAEIRSRKLVPLFRAGSVHSGSAS